MAGPASRSLASSHAQPQQLIPAHCSDAWDVHARRRSGSSAGGSGRKSAPGPDSHPPHLPPLRRRRRAGRHSPRIYTFSWQLLGHAAGVAGGQRHGAVQAGAGSKVGAGVVPPHQHDQHRCIRTFEHLDPAAAGRPARPPAGTAGPPATAGWPASPARSRRQRQGVQQRRQQPAAAAAAPLPLSIFCSRRSSASAASRTTHGRHSTTCCPTSSDCCDTRPPSSADKKKNTKKRKSRALCPVLFLDHQESLRSSRPRHPPGPPARRRHQGQRPGCGSAPSCPTAACAPWTASLCSNWQGIELRRAAGLRAQPAAVPGLHQLGRRRHPCTRPPVSMAAARCCSQTTPPSSQRRCWTSGSADVPCSASQRARFLDAAPRRSRRSPGPPGARSRAWSSAADKTKLVLFHAQQKAA